MLKDRVLNIGNGVLEVAHGAFKEIDFDDMRVYSLETKEVLDLAIEAWGESAVGFAKTGHLYSVNFDYFVHPEESEMETHVLAEWGGEG